MSGGHWNYVGQRIRTELQEVARDSDVLGRWPILARVLEHFSEQLYRLEREMDLDLSGDKTITHDRLFECEAVGALLDTILKALPETRNELSGSASVRDGSRWLVWSHLGFVWACCRRVPEPGTRT